MDKETLLSCIDKAIESIDIQYRMNRIDIRSYDAGILEGARKALEELKIQIEQVNNILGDTKLKET